MNRATFAAIVACVFVASPLHLPLNNPNEGVRVFAAKALVEHHTFAIDKVVKEWGYIDDKAKKDGHLYSSKAPLMTLIGAFAYAIVHPVTGDLSREALTRLCRGFGDALPTLLVAWLFATYLRRRVKDPVVADLSTVGVVLGSGVLASINVFSGHALAAIAPGAALLIALEENRSRNETRLIGLLLAATVGAEYPGLLACLPIVALTVAVSERRATAFVDLVVGALPIIVIVCVAHTAMFGAPWRTGYSFLENRGYQEVVAGTLFGIGAPKLDVLATVFFSPAVGLFFMSPVLLVGLIWCFRVNRALAWTVLSACVLMTLFIAGFRGWRGGWSVGPRYISELIGLLAIPAALALDNRPRVLAALVAIGVLHCGIAGMFFPHLSDVYVNPVYEFMLPVVGKGVAPDCLPLVLGLSSSVSVIVLLAFLALPLVLAARSALAVVVVVVAVLVGPHLGDTGRRGEVETQRLLENWRPKQQNLHAGSEPSGFDADGD